MYDSSLSKALTFHTHHNYQTMSTQISIKDRRIGLHCTASIADEVTSMVNYDYVGEVVYKLAGGMASAYREELEKHLTSVFEKNALGGNQYFSSEPLTVDLAYDIVDEFKENKAKAVSIAKTVSAPSNTQILSEYFDDLPLDDVHCDMCGAEVKKLFGYVIHLNDYHRLSRERIAKLLEDAGLNPERKRNEHNDTLEEPPSSGHDGDCSCDECLKWITGLQDDLG